MKLDTLYKKASTGSIQEWSISVTNPGEIVTVFGQVDGKLQTTTDLISDGKNVGKANETTPYEQAVAEATSKWEKKQKSGYVTTLDGAQEGALSSLIEGGIVPMLAHTFEKQGHKIKYPCYVQPKLDGIRCIAVIIDGKCTLWSRTRKPVRSVPHIIKEIEDGLSPIMRKGAHYFDGELYSHEYRNNFERIVSLARQEEPADGHEAVEYHIYDTSGTDKFSDRTNRIHGFFHGHEMLYGFFKYLKEVETILAADETDAMLQYSHYKDMGYEGAMLRNEDSLYVNKRSSDLIKVKEMQDSEFEITGIEEGRGKLSGHVGAFVCKTKDGQEFKAKPAGATERLREYFCDHSLWEGRELVVQYQSLTSYGIPRFPVGLRLKEQI